MKKDILRERWLMVLVAMACSSLGTLFWFWMKEGIIVGWVFGILFLATACIAAWQATRDDEWYQKRVLRQQATRNRYVAWRSQHPRKAVFLEIIVIAMVIGSFLISVIESPTTHSVLKLVRSLFR